MDCAHPWTIFLTMAICIGATGGIYQGNPALDGEFKYFALMQTPYTRCGSGIISEKHIVTAAHCVINMNKKELLVTAGVAHFESKKAVFRTVVNIQIHPEFRRYFGGKFFWLMQCILPGTRKTMEYDVAVLTVIFQYSVKLGIYDLILWIIIILLLNEPLVLTGNITKLDLPEANAKLPHCIPEELGGCGHIDDSQSYNPLLYWTLYTILQPAICKMWGVPTTPTQFCAIDPLGESCVMPGDSGSPWVHDNILYGIVSEGFCRPNYPAIFTSVPACVDFIKAAMEH